MWIKIICPRRYGKRLKLKSEELFIILYDASPFAEAAVLPEEANCMIIEM